MKTVKFILSIAIILILASCSKVNDKEMTIIKDCTGSYLRFNEKDYHICNIEIVEGLEDGTEVEASFEKIDNCPESNNAVCEMLHKNEGWVNVKKISTK